MTRWVGLALGVVLSLIGVVWTLQGSGVITGSVMTGSRFWLVIGVVALVVGIVLLVRTIRGRRPVS